MKKRLLAVVAMAAMLVMLVPSVAFAESDLPNAEVNNIGKQTISEYNVYNGSGFSEGDASAPIELQIALEFIAKDSPEEAQANAYANWTTDFYITLTGFEGKITLDDDCYLAGNYGTFGWIKVPVGGMEIESGKAYPVITSVGLDFKYVDICESVKNFKCGIHFSDAILEKHPEIGVQLDLGLSETLEEAKAAEFTRVDEPFTYDIYDLTGDERPAPPAGDDDNATKPEDTEKPPVSEDEQETVKPEKTPVANNVAETEASDEPESSDVNELTEEPEEATDTGDDMNVVLPIVLAAAALAAMAAVVATRRRHN